jgi:hypothetical protein
MRTTELEIIPLAVVAEQLGLSPRTLEDRRWRRRAKLPIVKIGGKIVGIELRTLRAALRRGREHLGIRNGNGT